MIERERTFYIAAGMPRRPKVRDRVMFGGQRMVVVDVAGDRVTVRPVERVLSAPAHRVDRLIS